jgi:hypothetical protein
VAVAAGAQTASTAPIGDCDAAIAALNKQLPVIAKRKIAVRSAQATSKHGKIAQAKRRYAASRKVANQIRTTIKQLCSSGAVSAFNALCTQSIDVYAGSLNQLATRKYEYRKIKGKGARAAKRKRVLKTRIKKLGSDVRKQSEAFHTACSNGTPKTPTTPPTGPTSNAFKDPVTTQSCTPEQFHNSLGCFAGAPAISIPSFPNGLQNNFQVKISGDADGICSSSGLPAAYKLMIIVDGDEVASVNGGGFAQSGCVPAIDLSTQIAALTLNPTRAHRIVLNLHTDVLLPETPEIESATMTADIAQL